MPYDLCVQAALIVLKHHLAAAITVSSDGGEPDWERARAACQKWLGYGEEFRLRGVRRAGTGTIVALHEMQEITLELKLQNKVALVTGASQGIGSAIALRLAAEGMAVAAVARNRDRLEALRQEIESHGGHCLVHAEDLRLAESAERSITATVEHFGRLDLRVNNAGPRSEVILTLADEDSWDGFALKFFGAVRLCRAAWPHLVAASHGSIVNIAGVGGRTGTRNHNRRFGQCRDAQYDQEPGGSWGA